jgi:hypothetical protein
MCPEFAKGKKADGAFHGQRSPVAAGRANLLRRANPRTDSSTEELVTFFRFSPRKRPGNAWLAKDIFFLGKQEWYVD